MQGVMDCCRWSVQVVLRPEPTKGNAIAQETLGSRAHLWLVDALSPLARDYENLPQTAETLIYLAMIRIMVRRLA